MGFLFCLIEDFFGLVVGVLFGWGFLCLIGFLGVLGLVFFFVWLEIFFVWWWVFCLIGLFWVFLTGWVSLCLVGVVHI